VVRRRLELEPVVVAGVVDGAVDAGAGGVGQRGVGGVVAVVVAARVYWPVPVALKWRTRT
jgi:hypothetical protein